MPPNNPLGDLLFLQFHKQALLLLNCVLRVVKKQKTKQKCIWWVWGMISANINFQILLCYSPMLLFSFLRNSFMQFRILLFPFEFCYSFFWFYYAITNFFIQFPILLFAFELCYAVFQSYYSTVQSSHVVSNPIISFQILLVTFPILLCHYEFF